MKNDAGFTLIEIMVVVAIVGIMALLAVWSVQDLNEQKRLSGTAHDVQMLMVKARATAQADSRLYKVCLYQDSNRQDQTAEGRIIVFRCGSNGFSGCPGGTVCNDVTANAGGFFSGSEVEGLCPTTAVNDPDLPEIWTTNPQNWCVEGPGQFMGNALVADGLDLASSNIFNYGGAPVVSIDHFGTFGDWGNFNTTTGNVIEVTYTPSGTVSPGRSTPGRTAGRVTFSSHTQCDPGESGGSFACTRNTLRTFSYSASGSFKIEQEREVVY